MPTRWLPARGPLVRWLRDDGLVLGACVAFTMVLAWRLGQEVGWDLRNYHFYVPHLLIHGRFAQDVEPAGVQTYFNPLLDLPFYVAVRLLRLRPIVVGLALAAVHGLALWLVYKAGRLLFAAESPALGRTAALVATATAGFGAAFRMEAGSTANDVTASGIALLALVVLLAGIDGDGNLRRRAVTWAALIAGLVTGAKLVAAMYGAGLLAATLLMRGSPRDRLVRAARFGAFFLLGLVLAQGYWSWLMYRHHGSPLFPFLDASGQSPYKAVNAYLEARFEPRDEIEALFYPFFFLRDQTLVSEAPFRDPRLAIAYVGVALLAAFVYVRLWRRGKAFDGPHQARLLAFLGFFVTAFVAWEYRSSIYRFAVGLELLAALLFVACLSYCLGSLKRALLVAVPVCLVAAIWTRPAAALVRVPWAPSYFGVDGPSLWKYRDATILMASFPSAYVVPFFPRGTSFVRIVGTRNWRHVTQPPMRREIASRLRDVDRRQVFLLDLPPGHLDEQQRHLDDLGLQIDPNRCEAIASLFERGRLCGMAGAGPVGRPLQPAAAPATYEGYHDVTNCNGITGWAWDSARPDVPLVIDVFDGARFLARVTADGLRPDLLAAGKGNGRHGFVIPTPRELRDGQPHDVYMRYAASPTDLLNGPKRIACAP